MILSLSLTKYIKKVKNKNSNRKTWTPVHMFRQLISGIHGRPWLDHAALWSNLKEIGIIFSHTFRQKYGIAVKIVLKFVKKLHKNQIIYTMAQFSKSPLD
jgi:hypothetical protein